MFFVALDAQKKRRIRCGIQPDALSKTIGCKPIGIAAALTHIPAYRQKLALYRAQSALVLSELWTSVSGCQSSL
jgi:hypothetical protein